MNYLGIFLVNILPCTSCIKLLITFLGKLTKLRIEHDNSGLGAGWNVDRVEVRMLNSSELVVFACHKWLDSSRGDGLICRDLLPHDN